MRKTMLALLALPVLAYLALCALMFFTQRGMVYFPQFTRVDASETNLVLERGDVTLRGWLSNGGGHDAVIYFGGNAEDVRGTHRELARRLPYHAVYAIAYRGYGASGGAPEETLLLSDALAIYNYVHARHLGQNISVIGRSLGSGVASYVASHREVHRLVLITPFDSLVGVGQIHYPWLPVRWLATERYESDRHLANYQKPVLILRAGRDVVVPPTSTDQLIEALPVPPVIFDSTSATHDSMLSRPDELHALVEFITSWANEALPGE